VTVVYEKEKGRIAPGAIHVKSFNFAQSLNATLFGDVLTGAVGFSANASAPGTLTTGGYFSVFPGSGLLTGNVHCSGATCFVVGLTPSVTNPLTTPLTGIFASGNLSGTGGPVNIFATFGTFGGIPISVNLTGLEVNRSAAPAPVTICHRPDNLSGWEQISIGAAAVDFHLRNHDDAVPGGVTTESGTSLGADCEPVPPCGDCLVSHGTPGCENGGCEAKVCAIDPFCCAVVWDSLCASEAASLCSGICSP
jgi:hypothetical protein